MHQQSALGKIAFKSHTRHWSLWAIILLCCAPRTGVGYVVLTKEGYSVEHHLMSQAGVVAGENFTVHGLTINTPTARLRCNPSRRGALRWSDSSEDNKDGPRGGSFEACDGENDWRPLYFCDLGCNLNLNKIPCSVPVLNKCNRACNQIGQGLNLRHCLLNIAKTQCGEPVTDNCNNVCGFLGEKHCDRGKDATQFGALVINSYDAVSQASFRFSVGTLEPAQKDLPLDKELDNALYLDFMKDGKAVNVPGEEDKVRPAALLKMEYVKDKFARRELEGPPPDFRTGLGGHNTENTSTYEKEGIDLAPPSDTTKDGGTPHIVRVSMYSEFTGGYIKVGQGHEEPAAYDKHQEEAIFILPGMHSFSSQPGPSVYAWGRWHPELQRIPLTERHRMLQLDDAAAERGFSFMAWIQRKTGGRGFAVRKLQAARMPLQLDRVFERGESVEQCWSWYMDGSPAFHFGEHDYSEPQYLNGPWSDGKLHLEAVVVTSTHVLMYQDLRLVREQTHEQAFNVTNRTAESKIAMSGSKLPYFPGEGNCSSANSSSRNGFGKTSFLQIGGSGLRMGDVKFFRHALSIEEMNATFMQGLPSKLHIDSLIESTQRGWMPRVPGSHTPQAAAEAQWRLSDATAGAAAEVESDAAELDRRDANRSRAGVDVVTQTGGLQRVERHYFGGEYSQDKHRSVHDGFQVRQQDSQDRAAWGYRQCPFLFNGGVPFVPDANNNNSGHYAELNLVRVCLDEPSQDRTLRLPDAIPDPLSTPLRSLSMGTEFERDLPHRKNNEAWSRTYAASSKQHRWLDTLSGVIISTGNMHDLAGVPGLYSRDPSIQFTGKVESEGASKQTFVGAARTTCCRNGSGSVNHSGCFQSSHYAHVWDLLNNTELRGAVDVPTWFHEKWLPLDGSSCFHQTGRRSCFFGAKAVPNEIYKYVLPAQECYFIDPDTQSKEACNFTDINATFGFFSRKIPFKSFVNVPVFTSDSSIGVPFPEEYHQNVIDFGIITSQRPTPFSSFEFDNGTHLVIARGCGIFDMDQDYFDFYRIYYKVQGWEDIIRRTIFKIQVLYRNGSASSLQERLNELREDSFFSQQGFLRRFDETDDYRIMLQVAEQSALSPDERKNINSSIAAAEKLKLMMEWRDAQRGGSSIMLLNGVSTAPDELKGFYAVIPSRYEHGRPVYQQLGVAAPNYIYATTEWYSSIEMWAVGPEIGSTDTWLKVNSEAEFPNMIKEHWQELSTDFPVKYRPNVNLKILPQSTNVTQAELALVWSFVMLNKPLNKSSPLGKGRAFEFDINIGPVTDAERCFVCSCASNQNCVARGREYQEPPEGLQCVMTDWQYECEEPTKLNTSSMLSFETPQADRFLQFPPTSGRIVSSGNLKDIISIGVQGTPIMGFSHRQKAGLQSVTSLRFGAHEPSQWPPNTEDCLAMGCSPTDPIHTNTPEELFGCYCDPSVQRRNTSVFNSVSARADLLARNYSAKPSHVGNEMNLPASDGILLTTGNLEDVMLEGSSMTGLNISGDLQVHGWVQFGSGKHSGSCEWTECSDPHHTRTNGILLPTFDHVSGWEHRRFSECAASDLGIPSGFLSNPSEWMTLNNTCWESKFGSYCFEVHVLSLQECLSQCSKQSCSLIAASSFKLADLVAPKFFIHGASMSLEVFKFDCQADPLAPDTNVCLYKFRKSIDEISQKGLARKTRFYLAGGGKNAALVDLAAVEANLTMIRSWQHQAVDAYECLRKICNLFEEDEELSLVNEPGDLLDKITKDSCKEKDMHGLGNQINFRGVTLSCDNLVMDMSFNNLTLLSFQLEEEFEPYQAQLPSDLDQVVATIDSLQAIYDELQKWRETNEQVLQEKTLLANQANSLAPPSFVAQEHLWNGQKTANGNRFRYHGYCVTIDPVQGDQVLSCHEGTHIQGFDFAVYGESYGICGLLSSTSCSIDAQKAFQNCIGQEQCTISLQFAHNYDWTRRPWLSHCREAGITPQYHLQVRCGGTPYLSLMHGQTFGVSYEYIEDLQKASLPGYKPSTWQKIRNSASELVVQNEENIRCALAAAQPPLMQAHMCTPETSYEVDTFVYKGFHGDLAMLLENEGEGGRKTVLRLESLPESHGNITDTEVLLPATNGIILTSGNLRDITVESGPITSIAVRKPSFLKGGLTVGPLKRLERYSAELLQNVHDSWWDGVVTDANVHPPHDGVQRSRAEGGAKWDWENSNGPWLTIFGNGDCVHPQHLCVDDNIDRAFKFNVSDGGLTHVDFEILAGVVSQILFPVSWGIREGDFVAHGYSEITGGGYSQHICNPHEVLGAHSSRCVSRIISTGNLDEIRSLSPLTTSVTDKTFLRGPVILGSGQSIHEIAEAFRGPPGAYGTRHPTEHRYETYNHQWRQSTSAGLGECLTPSDPRCGGSPQSHGISPVILGGSVKGDLFYRNVPRDNVPSSLDSTASSEYLGLSFVPFQWMHLQNSKCLLPSEHDLPGTYATEKNPAYDGLSLSQRRSFEPRLPVVQTYTSKAPSLNDCKLLCEENHACGIVTYQILADGLFGCTMSLLPAPTCVRTPGRSDQGILLYPRDEIIRLTTDAPSANRKLLFPGERSGVVLTSGNPGDVWGLPNLQNVFEVAKAEEMTTGDIFRHYQRPSTCEGLSTVMPDCTTPSMMDRCMKRHFPSWKGFGSMPNDWQSLNLRACEQTNNRINVEYAAALADNFQQWTRIRQVPYVGVGVAASGYKCRAGFDSAGNVVESRPDLMTIFTESGFKMPNNASCSTRRGEDFRPFNQPGMLPQYLDPVDFKPVHPEPESMANRRITFPDASGTVITSGNLDDVVFQKMLLRNVFVDGMVYAGTTKSPEEPAVFETDQATIIRWTDNFFIRGRLNMLSHTNFRDEASGPAYGDPALLTTKPSGSITGIINFQVRLVKVCVNEFIYDEKNELFVACPFQGGQDSCPRRGPMCSDEPGAVQVDQCREPTNSDGFNWRGDVLNDDCQSDTDCGNQAEIGTDPNKAQVCRDTRVCLRGPYAGEACMDDTNCCEKGYALECENKCHGIEQYLLRKEQGGFHTNYYRNAYLQGCAESPTNLFFCTHNDIPDRSKCASGDVGEIPMCAHGGQACCCDPDLSCEDGTDAWCCREDCPGGKGVSCTKAQPGGDVWVDVKDVVGPDMEGLKHTSIGSFPITKINEILLPNVSGTMLTTGNLRELPSIFLNITGGQTEIGGHTGFAGDIQFGGPSKAGNLRFYSFINGEQGMTFRTAAGCSSVEVKGSTLYPHVMGIYFLYPETYQHKPVWKHRTESFFIFYKAQEGVDSRGEDRGEGGWHIGKFIGAEQLLADASPLLLKMKHMTFSPVDADLRMSGPLYAGEGPGAWEVWLTEGKGRWAVDENVTSGCLVPKTTQDHLTLSVPPHASKGNAIRHYLQSQARSLPIKTEEERFFNYQYQVEQHPVLPGQVENDAITISRCYSLMLSAGQAPNATCAQEHNCFQTEDTRPWNMHTFNNYLRDLGMLQPTLIRGQVSVGLLREWTGCSLMGQYVTATFKNNLEYSSFNQLSAEIRWSPTVDARLNIPNRFRDADANRNSRLSRDEWRALGRLYEKELEAGVFNFLRPRVFDYLDIDEDGELTLEEVMSGVAVVHLDLNPIDASSYSTDRLIVSGTWTLRKEDTWSTTNENWRDMTLEEFEAEMGAVPSGGTLDMSIDEQCGMSLVLTTYNEASESPNSHVTYPTFSQTFLKFSDGQQTEWMLDGIVPVNQPLLNNVSSYVFRDTQSQSKRSKSRLNTQYFTFFASEQECERVSSLGFECQSEQEVQVDVSDMTAAAQGLFEDVAMDSDALPNVLESWQATMFSLGLNSEGINSKTSCVISMNLTSSMQRAESLHRIRFRRHAPRQGLDASQVQSLRGLRIYGVLRPQGDYREFSKTTPDRLVNLHFVHQIPVGDEWAQVLLDGEAYDNLEMLWITSSDPRACVSLAQVEVHTGPISQTLSPDMPGTDSYYVDERKLQNNAEAVLIAKCAAKGWFPSFSWTESAELALPGVNGRLLSTGTLDDISKEHGPVTSMLVGSDSHSHFFGNVRLGHVGAHNTAQFFSALTGTQAVQFGRSANLDEHRSSPPSMRLHGSAASSGENLIMLPNVVGTMILQNAPHLSLSSHESLSIGQAAVLGPLAVQASLLFEPRPALNSRHLEEVEDFLDRRERGLNVHEGYPQVPTSVSERLWLESEVTGRFPLKFSPRGGNAFATHTLAVDQSVDENWLVLPDMSGTVVTTGDIPPFLEQDMVSPDLLYFGDASFSPRSSAAGPRRHAGEPDVAFGSAESTVTVEMNSVLRTRAFDGLVFEGSLDDGRTTSLYAESASGRNILTLPDTDGIVLMTGSLPDTLPFLTVLDRVDILHGDTILGASGGTHVTLGSDVEHSIAWFHHVVSGRFPLQFSGLPPSGLSPDSAEATMPGPAKDDRSQEFEDTEEESDGGPSLRIQVTESLTHNVITLPDVSGTVITTGNVEPLLSVPHTPVYHIHAKRVMLAASQLLAFGSQAAELTTFQSESRAVGKVCAQTPSPYPGYSSPPETAEAPETGIFAFLDSSHKTDPRNEQMPKVDDNSFFVRAHGGVRLVTGIVQRPGQAPREIGVQIAAKGSCWSILSDMNAKTNISQVDDRWVLQAMLKVPVSTWQYKGASEGAGVNGTGVTHMGPMAQDFNEALAPLNLGKTAENRSLQVDGETEDHSRILTSTADGALMSAVRGMALEIGAQSDRVDDLEAEMEMLTTQLRNNGEVIRRNAAVVSRQRRILAHLDVAIASLFS